MPSEVDGVRSFPQRLISFLRVLLQTAFYTNLNSTLFAAFNGSLQDEVSVYCAANANVCFGGSVIDQPFEPDLITLP